MPPRPRITLGLLTPGPMTAMMYRHHVRAYNEMAQAINHTDITALAIAVQTGDCPYRPELLRGFAGPAGFCPLCGTNITNGQPHPPYDTENLDIDNLLFFDRGTPDELPRPTDLDEPDDPFNPF